MTSSEKPFEYFDELGRLLSGLAEGELSAEESARLRQILARSPQARRYYLEYLQLHAELYWAAGPGQEVERATPALAPECPLRLDLPVPWTVTFRRGLRRWRWVLMAACVLGALGLGILFVRTVWKPAPADSPSGPGSGLVARWGQTSLPQWAENSATPQTADTLTAGQFIELQSGFVELLLDGQTRLILQGPARLQLLGPCQVELCWGRVSVHVAEQEGPVSVRTSFVEICGPTSSGKEQLPLEKGQATDFGIWIEPTGLGEVHGFSGQVELQVRPPCQGLRLRREDTGPRSKAEQSEENPSGLLNRYYLEASQAVRMTPAAETEKVSKGSGTVELVEISPDLPSFVVRLPPEPWVQRLSGFRAEVAKHPALLHHYTFEGGSPDQRRQDKRGQLHLVEVVMSGGRGEGTAQFLLAPPGAEQWAFHPARGLYAGNRLGAALQTEAVFHPPESLTVELLVNFAGFPPRQKDPLGTLLATRTDARQCSFFLAVGSEGQILHLFDAEHPWHEADVALIPGEWYYLASTFQTDSEKQTTTVNTYLANLTRGETGLQWVVQNRKLEGIPVPSRLGVGKGFDQDGAHAYPWAGLLDEIAIYRTILDRDTLQKHLFLLVNPLLGKPESPKPETPPLEKSRHHPSGRADDK